GSATNSFFCWTQTTNKAYKGYKPGRHFNFNTSDAEAIRRLPELDLVHPMNQLGGHDEASNVVRGLKTVASEILATYPFYSQISEVKLEKGRFINELDVREKRKVCVIGPRVVEVLFKKGEEVIGQYIRVNGVYFKIVGLTRVTGSGGEGREQAQRI